MSHCNNASDNCTSSLLNSCSTNDCTCDGANNLSVDSCSNCDIMYVNSGHSGSTDSIYLSGEGKNNLDGVGEVDNTSQEYNAVQDQALRSTGNVDHLNVTNLICVQLSNDCCNDLVTDVYSAGCNNEAIHSVVDGPVKPFADVIVASNGCCGNERNHFSVTGAWKVDGPEIVCDYVSVRDDESVASEAFTGSSRDENKTQLLPKDAVILTNSTSFTDFYESRKHFDIDMRSSLENSSNVNELVNSSVKLSVAICSVEKSQDVTDRSAFADGLSLPSVDQLPGVSYCPFPPVAQWLADLPQSPLATSISSPPFSFLPPPPLIQTELPSVQFRPIFYICSDQKPPLEQEESCTIDMNILQKSEISNVTHHFTERCDSQLSTLSEKQDICRICHCEGEPTNKLISPCLCSGSLKFIHLSCLQKWIKSSDKKSCELCNFDYIMTMKTRPFKQWERLDMAMAERRKIVCSVTFHVIAITCVIWSLYVLIDRTSEEVNSGALDWPFWTKLIVVAIGFTGGLVFMYVQVKMYLQLCMRWRQFNKLISIENAPEDTQLRAEAAARIKARSGEPGGVVNSVALQEVESF